MKRIICILFPIFSCLTSFAQAEFDFDTLRISQIVYFHTVNYYDSIKNNYVEIRLLSEYEKPTFRFKCTLRNKTEKTLHLTTGNTDWYAIFDVDSVKYKAFISMNNIGSVYINPNESKEFNLIEPSLFSHTRELESKRIANLVPLQFDNYSDYSNIIYKMLPSFKLILKQEDLELTSGTPDVIILNKYYKGNLDDYNETKNEIWEYDENDESD